MKLKATKGRSAKAAKVQTPEFRSAAEERAWWDEHRERITDLLIKYGRPVAARTRTVTIRIAEQDLARAKEIARREGVKYQPLLKSLLHDALRRYRAKA
jgi:predicted DNA binding CopG/RHH family protein